MPGASEGRQQIIQGFALRGGSKKGSPQGRGPRWRHPQRDGTGEHSWGMREGATSRRCAGPARHLARPQEHGWLTCGHRGDSPQDGVTQTLQDDVF